MKPSCLVFLVQVRPESLDRERPNSVPKSIVVPSTSTEITFELVRPLLRSVSFQVLPLSLLEKSPLAKSIEEEAARASTFKLCYTSNPLDGGVVCMPYVDSL